MPSFQMTCLPRSLPFTYNEALREHLAQPDTTTLEQAFELGRAAKDGGMEVFDLVRIHHQALAEGVLASSHNIVPERFASSLDSFLLEALLPFGISDGSHYVATDRRTGTKAEYAEALALRNAELEDEIAEHRRVEAAMQAGKEHYVHLYQKARAMEASLRELSAQVLSAQEEERRRISRELHDEIGQALTAINVTIAMLKRQVACDPAFQRNVAEAEQLLAHTLETVHCFARELRPAMLDHLGLQSALRAHILAFTRQTGIRTELVPHPLLARLDERRGEVLFRVAQEALNNVFKHAGATAARIEFTSTEVGPSTWRWRQWLRLQRRGAAGGEAKRLPRPPRHAGARAPGERELLDRLRGRKRDAGPGGGSPRTCSRTGPERRRRPP
jgi:signal transduction histidine kinase